MGMLGKYGIKLVFADDSAGYFMEVYEDKKSGERPVVFVTNNWDSAEKYLTVGGAEKAFKKFCHLKNTHSETITEAYIIKDRESVISKIKNN